MFSREVGTFENRDRQIAVERMRGASGRTEQSEARKKSERSFARSGSKGDVEERLQPCGGVATRLSPRRSL